MDEDMVKAEDESTTETTTVAEEMTPETEAANSPTTADTTQTAEERFAQARQTAMANHNAERVMNGATAAEVSDEEEIV